MREILIVGRGGQGAQTAGNLLAQAFFSAGQYVQSFATYGGARRGTQVSSTIRVDARPIRLRCDVTQADALLCFDASLLDQALLNRTRPEALIVVNSVRSPEEFAVAGERRVYTIDGFKLAEAHNLGRFINSALLGAFCAALRDPPAEVMSRTISETTPDRRPENLAAFHAGFRTAEGIA